MDPLEASLLTASLLAICAIFVTEWVRARIPPSGKLSPPMLMFVRISLGVVFVILGIIGSLLPILQGWIFFLIAALLLFPRSRFAVKALDKIEPRMPRLVGWFRRIGIGTHDEQQDTMHAP